MSSIASEKYVRLTTFTKDGRPKYVPVWIVDLGDGDVGFTTEPESWKAKRIRNTPKVELVACSARGKVTEGAPTVTGTARVVTGAEFEPVMAATKAKYGFQMTMVQFIGKVRGLFGRGSDTAEGGIIITLD
ncbi:MAG: PPOX class F420-dependent oxidoreductase [Actinomycetota bacterium]